MSDDVHEIVSTGLAGCLTRLWRHGLVLSGNKDMAEDLVQATFPKAYQILHRYDKRWRFTTWLFTIGRRLAIDRSRRNQPIRQQAASDNLEQTSAGPARLTMLAEQRVNLWKIVQQKLTAAQAEALWLRYGESLNVSEIAKVMGKSQVGVRVTLLRARKTLAPHVQKWNDVQPTITDIQERVA